MNVTHYLHQFLGVWKLFLVKLQEELLKVEVKMLMAMFGRVLDGLIGKSRVNEDLKFVGSDVVSCLLILGFTKIMSRELEDKSLEGWG